MKPSLPIPGTDDVERITKFVKKVVYDAEAKGVAVGLSGGIDSAVSSALCVRALGKDRVLGVLMPSNSTPRRDMADARALASRLGIRLVEIGVSSIVDALISSASMKGTKLSVANVQARARMMVLYFLANSSGLLVVGTGDRSEIEMGYFTKYGDGGADFLPIGHLYKTQVRGLGRILGVPKTIVNKASSPALWPGQTAKDELPVEYPRLDAILHLLLDEKRPPPASARIAGVSLRVVERIQRMHRRSAHKRELPPRLSD